MDLLPRFLASFRFSNKNLNPVLSDLACKMSAIFDSGARASILQEDPYRRIRGLHPNCFAAPPCSSPFRAPLSNSNNPFNSNTPFSTPPSSAGTDYAGLTFSRTNTPLSLSTPLSTPASRCVSPILKSFHVSQLQAPGATNIKLLPFTKEDAEATATLFERAFEHDGIRRAIMPPDKLNPEDPLEERRWRVRLYEEALKIPGHRIVKAVDEAAGGRTIGAAGYFGPGGFQWEEDVKAKEALPGHWDLKMQEVAIDIIKEKRGLVLKGDYNVWGKAH